MINGIGKVTQSLNEKLQKWQSFFCFTRGIDFQREATIEFECIYNEALSLKSKAIELEDEDTANLMLCLEKFIVCLINELKMWISIKEGNSHEAWNCLVVAQSAGRCALSAHHTGVTYEAHILRLELI